MINDPKIINEVLQNLDKLTYKQLDEAVKLTDKQLSSTIFINVSLQEMFNTLINCIINNKEQPTYYYKREYEKDYPEFIEITEVDLIRGRFKTIDDDFSEYEWELEDSHIYIKEE